MFRSNADSFDQIDDRFVDQLSHREFCLDHRLTALPPEKARQQFANEGPEDHGFGEKKMAKVNKAIEDVQPYWFRESLSLAENTLEEFLG